MTYANVVGRETVRIPFLVAALNDLKVLAGDIQNTYLYAFTKEKIYFKAGDEWKADKGKIIVITRALYDLKSSALMWRNHLADIIGTKLGFKSSLADPDLWYKPMITSEGIEYYVYILVYVDDILIIDINPNRFMDLLKDTYTVKPSSIGEPRLYLGADMRKVYYNDDSYAWSKGKLSDPNYLPKVPFSSVDYKSELDISLE